MPLTPMSSSAADASLIYVIGRVNQGIRRELRARLSEWDLSVPEFTALSILERRPGLSNAQLARRTMVTPQSMIEILAGLENDGLVVRNVDPEHGRILRTELSRQGRRLLAAAEPAIREIEEEMLRDVPERQRHIVLDGMMKAMERLTTGLQARDTDAATDTATSAQAATHTV